MTSTKVPRIINGIRSAINALPMQQRSELELELRLETVIDRPIRRRLRKNRRPIFQAGMRTTAKPRRLELHRNPQNPDLAGRDMRP